MSGESRREEREGGREGGGRMEEREAEWGKEREEEKSG